MSFPDIQRGRALAVAEYRTRPWESDMPGSITEVTAYLGLGTNLGDCRANLRDALRLLASEAGLRLLRCSQVYETEPWGVTEQPRFLNCVAEVASTLEPEPLLARCKEVEEHLAVFRGRAGGHA